MTFWNILLIFALISLNAFFTATEFAVVASRRARLDVLVEADDPAGRIVRSWLESPAARDRLIAATQLGITAVSLALGAAGENAFEAWLGPYFLSTAFPPALQMLDVILPFLPLVLSLLVVTSLHVVLGEQVPKVAVLRSPERFALAAAPAMRLFLAVFRWFVSALDWATRSVLRLFGVQAGSVHSILYTVEEIKEMVSGPEVEGVLEEPERQMLRDVLDFGNLIVRQVALPRTEILAMEASASLEEVTRLAVERSVTKIPIYEGTPDKMLGIVHVRDILAVMASGQAGA
jgi:CBS domain containing-hemolysin-like protein